MPRIKRGVHHVKRRKNILKKTKGYMWGRKNKLKQAKVAVTKAGVNAYRDRRLKKRTARGTWQVKLNAALRPHGWSYSRFIDALKKANIGLDRKVLADIAENEPTAFVKILESLKK